MSKYLFLVTLLFGVSQSSNITDNNVPCERTGSFQLCSKNGTLAHINQLAPAEVFELSTRKYSSIEPALFRNINVTELRITGWQSVIDVEPQVFEGLPLVTILSIYETNFSLTHNPFEVLRRNITEFKYKNSNLTTVPQEVISYFPNLKRLQLLGCVNLTKIDASSFTNISEDLEQLTFNGSSIHTIEPGAFNKFKKLQRLSLRDNKIADLQPGVFRSLDSLYHLSLDGNKLTGLREGIFNRLSELRILSIKNNEITNAGLEPEAFARLNLRLLALSGNKLTVIPTGCFRYLKSLKSFFLQYCKIETIHSNAFEELSNLEYLGLEKSQINNIEPNAFFGLSFDGKPLPLNDCSIPHLRAGTFNGLIIKNAHLNLLHNEFTTIEDGTFKNMTAQTVVIDPKVDRSNLMNWGGNVTIIKVCPDNPEPCYDVYNSGKLQEN